MFDLYIPSSIYTSRDTAALSRLVALEYLTPLRQGRERSRKFISICQRPQCFVGCRMLEVRALANADTSIGHSRS